MLNAQKIFAELMNILINRETVQARIRKIFLDSFVEKQKQKQLRNMQNYPERCLWIPPT